MILYILLYFLLENCFIVLIQRNNTDDASEREKNVQEK